jgi:hypothetical protein
MKKVKLITIFGILILFSSTSFVSAQQIRAQYQSLFIYNFTKYIKWPPSHSTGDFVIGVYNDAPLLSEMLKMRDLKKNVSLGRPMVIREIKEKQDLDGCHIVYISETLQENMSEIDLFTTGKPILLITEFDDAIEKGSIINFVPKKGKIKFEINEKRATECGLRISSTLLDLAKQD